MPFAVIATILIVCAIYLPIHLVAAGMLDNLASEQAPLASVAGILAGPAGRYGMTFIAATSMAGCALISLVGGTRLMYSMSSARQLPDWMGSLHAVWRTPVRATMIIGVLGTALAIGSVYSTLAAISAGTRLLVYLACCLACLRRPSATREDGGPGEPGGLRGRIIPALTSVAIVALLCALERKEVIGGLSGVGIGTVLYFGMRRAVQAVGGRTS
jgi:APA family basic amino acid/polyamine antiporter